MSSGALPALPLCCRYLTNPHRGSTNSGLLEGAFQTWFVEYCSQDLIMFL